MSKEKKTNNENESGKDLNIDSGVNTDQLNESKLPDFEFTPPPPKEEKNSNDDND